MVFWICWDISSSMCLICSEISFWNCFSIFTFSASMCLKSKWSNQKSHTQLLNTNIFEWNYSLFSTDLIVQFRDVCSSCVSDGDQSLGLRKQSFFCCLVFLDQMLLNFSVHHRFFQHWSRCFQFDLFFFQLFLSFTQSSFFILKSFLQVVEDFLNKLTKHK